MDGECDLARNEYSHRRNGFLKKLLSSADGAGQQAGVSALFTERWRERIAPEEVVYAQNQGSLTSPVRTGTAARADCPQLFDWPGDGASIFGESVCYRSRLAVARRVR